MDEGPRDVKLKHAANFIAGGTPSVDDPSMWSSEPGTGTPWISIGDMSQGGRVVSSGRWISDAGIRDRRLTVADPGTVLFAMYASVGAIATLGVPATWNQAILGIRPFSERADSRFVAYWLQHIVPEAKALVRASTQDNLNADQVANFPFSALPLQDQQRIADFLDDQVARIDNIIAGRRSQIELIDSQRVCELDSLIGDGERPVARLALFAQIQSGITVDAGRESVDGIDVPYLRVANVQAGALNLDEVKSIRVARSQVLRYLLHDGDVLMTEGGDIDKLGRGTVWRSQVPDAIHQNHVFAVRVDQSRLIPKYLAYVTASSPARHYFELTGNRTTNLASTSATKVLDLRIPVRGVGEQTRVVEAAEEADSRARAGTGLLLDSIARVEELKRSLITAAVTGDFDVSAADGSRVLR